MALADQAEGVREKHHLTYITKRISNGLTVGLTHGEIVLPVNSLEGLSDPEISQVVRELVDDYAYLEPYFGGGDLSGMTIQEAREHVKRIVQRQRSTEVKRDLTEKRRREFNSKQAQLMLALIDRDGYTCQYPGCDMQKDLTVDHILPLSKGGSDSLENLRLLCRSHNSQKGDASPDE